MPIRSRAPWIAALILVLLAGLLLWQRWGSGALRRDSLRTLTELQGALATGQSERLLELMVVPGALQTRAPAEQTEFLAKALAGEVSPEGIAVLSREGQFGPLKEIFPDEADKWATQGGADPTNCVAFRLERNGARAEVVLVRNSAPPQTPATYRIIRCNDVSRMAAAN